MALEFPMLDEQKAPNARPLETEEQIRQAIKDMEALMERTAELYYHYEREVYRRLPQNICVAGGAQQDLSNLQSAWRHCEITRNLLIVKLFYMKEASA